LLYLAAAVLLVFGFVALPSVAAAGRGSRLTYVAAGLAAVGAVWYGIEAALMRSVEVLAESPDTAAAAHLVRLNEVFGIIAVLPWLFYLAPLAVAIGLRRARVAGAWLIGLWATGFLVGFVAHSPLGEAIPVLSMVGDALLSAVVVAIAFVMLRRPVGSSSQAPVQSAGSPLPANA
jgi:hypothetical protein